MKEMRRTDRLITREEAFEVLKKGEYGILSTVGSDGQPYGVPLNYVVMDQAVYYHATNVGGAKYDNIMNNNKVGFTVVGDTQVLPDQFGTLYESAIVYGEASVVEDEGEKLVVFREFLKKYCSGFLKEGEEYISNAGPKAMIVKIEINALTGKGRKK